MTNDNPLKFEALRSDVHAALRSVHKLEKDAETYLDHLVLVQMRRDEIADSNPTLFRLATNQVLLEAINRLKEHNSKSAQILGMRFFDDDTVLMTGNKLKLTEDVVKKEQQKAIKLLAQILLTQEQQAREQRIQTIETNLDPPSYTTLFGIEDAGTILVDKLLADTSPWILAITGIGGIGKSTLADATARKVIRHFHYEDVIWLHTASLTNKQNEAYSQNPLNALIHQLIEHLCPHLLLDNTSPKQQYAQIRRILNAAPYLIIIDNLETEAELNALFPHLNDLTNPTRFLLTSRTLVTHHVGVFGLSLTELSLDDATALVRHHARDINLLDLADITSDEAKPIYQVTGGNPLALKLIIGLATAKALPLILQDLVDVQSDQIEKLYRRIYWQTWNTLDKNAQALLEMMPMSGVEGMGTKQLRATSEMKERVLWDAVTELTNRSLLEVRGTVWERRYGIHRLTETFLQTEIIHWPKEFS